MHEDNEVLGIFALEDYTHMTTGQGLLLWGGFISCILGITYLVTVNYPGKPSAPTEYPGGLDQELGGAGAVRVRSQPCIVTNTRKREKLTISQAHKAGDPVKRV